MKYVIDPEAFLELDDAVRYYEQQREGLGLEFLAEIRATIARILSNPEQFPILTRNARRARIHRFPYGVVYRTTNDIVVLAVMHLHRKPGYWKHRGQ